MNFRKLTMEFFYKGRKHLLSGRGKQITTTCAGKLAKMSGIKSKLCMIQVVPSKGGKGQWHSIKAKENFEKEPRLLSLLQEYQTLFE